MYQYIIMMRPSDSISITENALNACTAQGGWRLAFIAGREFYFERLIIEEEETPKARRLFVRDFKEDYPHPRGVVVDECHCGDRQGPAGGICWCGDAIPAEGEKPYEESVPGR